MNILIRTDFFVLGYLPLPPSLLPSLPPTDLIVAQLVRCDHIRQDQNLGREGGREGGGEGGRVGVKVKVRLRGEG